MAEAKNARAVRAQLGQFMTPRDLSRRILDELTLKADIRVLEPSFGDGAFLLPIIERLMALQIGSENARFEKVMTDNVYGVELDPSLYERCIKTIEARFGTLPRTHNLQCMDFFRTTYMRDFFDIVVGNPPYGGTIAPDLQDSLDRKFGSWGGHKLKKETYSFFIASCLELLAPEGTLKFVSSDTFMTIKTMGGLRRRLVDECAVELHTLRSFSSETVQPTLILTATRSSMPSDQISIDGNVLTRADMELSGNFSWRMDAELAQFFQGPTLSEFMVATGGMTIGKNELFVRELGEGGTFSEPYDFEFYDDPVTVEKELAKARLNQLSPKLIAGIAAKEAAGFTLRSIRVAPRPTPAPLEFPHPDYRPYNKASSSIVYSPPRSIVYWKDEGDAVLTYKKTGNWYLHGVGGQKFFGRSGLTWQLVSPRLNIRYLPQGYILDSGAPCAFLREGVDPSELWFILGWGLTEACTRILKTVINHTRNIQGKDFERLPYPVWVNPDDRLKAIDLVVRLVDEAQEGRTIARTDGELRMLDELYALPPS